MICQIRRLIAIAGFVTLLIVSAFQYQITAAPSLKAVAMVADVKGVGEIVPAGSSQKAPLCLLAELNDGDVVSVMANGTAKIVYYSDTHSELLKGPCSVRIAPGSCALVKGEKGSLTSLAPFKGIKALTSIKASGERFGGVSTRGQKINILRPRGFVAVLNPVFQWEARQRATEYQIKLCSEKREEIARLKTGKTSLEYPDSSPALQFGKTYFWTVYAFNGSDRVDESEAAFGIISRDLRERLDTLREQAGMSSDDKTAYSVLLAFCLENLLLDEALDTCRKLLADGGEGTNIHYWMGRIYEAKNMSKEAKEEYKKAGVQSR